VMGRTAEGPRPRDGRPEMLVLGEPTRMAACISRDQIEKAPLESAHHSPVGRMTGDSNRSDDDHPGRVANYDRRRPEETLLYQVIQKHWRPFLAADLYMLLQVMRKWRP